MALFWSCYDTSQNIIINLAVHLAKSGLQYFDHLSAFQPNPTISCYRETNYLLLQRTNSSTVLLNNQFAVFTLLFDWCFLFISSLPYCTFYQLKFSPTDLWLSTLLHVQWTPFQWTQFHLPWVSEMCPEYILNQFSSVAQLCPTLCDPMNCSMPGFPVHHQLPGLTQTHVHWVGDAIQPSHLLSSPSLSAFNLSQPQGLFQWVSSSHQVAKVLEFQLQHQSFQWIFRTDFLQDGLIGSLCSPRDSQESSPTPQFKSINSLAHDYWKNHSSD